MSAVQQFSPAKLVMVHSHHQARVAARDRRALLVASAAAAGGEAPARAYRLLAPSDQSAKSAPSDNKSSIPLNQSDFETMLRAQ
jgi:hypothetical protein